MSQSTSVSKETAALSDGEEGSWPPPEMSSQPLVLTLLATQTISGADSDAKEASQASLVALVAVFLRSGQ